MEHGHPVPASEESFLRLSALTRRNQSCSQTTTKVRATGEVSCVMRISGGISGLIADGWHSSHSFILSQPSVAWTIRQISSAGGFIRSRFAAGMRTLSQSGWAALRRRKKNKRKPKYSLLPFVLLNHRSSGATVSLASSSCSDTQEPIADNVWTAADHAGCSKGARLPS